MKAFWLYTIIKTLLDSTITKRNNLVIVSDKVKNDTTIEFKNGSYIKVVTSKESVRGNRSKIIKMFE